MFGESGETPGAAFPRLDTWDARRVTPPALLGIAYERIDEHTYVEPNRDYRSTFFRSFFELDRTYRYEVWLDLHQTEFLHSDRNAQAFMPTCYDDLPEAQRARIRSLAEALHTHWRTSGGAPADAPGVPYRTDETQRNFLTRVWRPIAERIVLVVTEIQNNHPRTPPPLQVHLQLSAIAATMEWMARGNPA
jgi:hypothetical protein